MPFRFRRRRLLRPLRRRGLAAAVAVLLVTSTAVAGVIVSERDFERAAALIAHPVSGAQATPSVAAVPPDDIDPSALAQPAATAPPLPGSDDPRLRAIPHITPPAVGAGPHAVNVPILMYHFLRTDLNPSDVLGWRLSVTPGDFALQLSLLKREGFTTVSLGDVVNAMRTGAPLPARPIVLTFDDGYRNFATVGAPLLSAAGFTATSFVVSGFVGRPGFMTADQVRQVAAMGMTIGAHTEHHADLVRVTPAVMKEEIAGSRAALEALIGTPVTDFAYPSGQFDQQVVEQVQQAGFRDAVTTVGGVRHDAGLEFTLTRVRVSGGESLLAFAQSLGATAPGSSAAGQPSSAPAGTPSPATPSAAIAPASRPSGGRGVRPS